MAEFLKIKLYTFEIVQRQDQAEGEIISMNWLWH